MLPMAEVGILLCTVGLLITARILIRLIDSIQKKGSGEPSVTFKKSSKQKSTQIKQEVQLQNRQIAHSYKTAQTLIKALNILHKAGVAPEKSRAKLPAGIRAVQQLTDDQAKSYLIDLRNLYLEALKAKRMQAA